MQKVSFITNSCKKLPERLIYNTKNNSYFKERETARIFDTKKSIILGEIITEPANFTCFRTKFPAVKSLSIIKLRAYIRNKGVGTDLLNFAKRRSHQKGCEGRMHLISSDCYDNENPPHVFYRKYGFTSHETNKLKEIDSHIATDKPEYFLFEELGMFYPPDTHKGEVIKKDIDKTTLDCENTLKKFIKSLFSK